MSKIEIEKAVDKLLKEKRKIKKVRGDFNDIVFYAFRYCLGRRTFAPSTCSEFVRTNIDLIRNKDISLMIKEIGECEHLGNDCDVETWTNLQHFLINEQKKRNDNIR